MIGETSRDREATGRSPALELELQRNVQAPGIARAAVTELSQVLGLGPSTFQTLVLLVSEVVSNAVLHSRGPGGAPITLIATVTTEKVRVTVTDAGEGFVPKQRDPASIHDGYGLYLVDKAATRWGVDTAAPTSVWFELPRVA
ncbi:MAG: putative anti-sigma regulatory factor, serine/threonine protein kinase [Solirubrobacterales bacterium]|jgi:anti-sigma regulatory factor (Ser/Thr protein kinase)|nr:putative anti-sigma regulatory factor, serine/threonine protein kinase [Solirubrobacterales bacterium]MCW3025849.1 putative anti-sigma regulatory factor, serine/threonine protein kinase [Solirubrobacterales bacterium]